MTTIKKTWGFLAAFTIAGISNSNAQDGVTLWEDNEYKDTVCPVPLGQSVPSFNPRDFGDEADSMKWRLPRGTCVVLFEHDNYKKARYVLVGCGECPKMDNLHFGDNLDSCQYMTEAAAAVIYPHVPRLGS